MSRHICAIVSFKHAPKRDIMDYMAVDVVKRKIGNRIKSLREAHGYTTKKALADALDIEPSTVQRWEAGAYIPDGPNLEKLAKLFDLTPDEVTDYSLPAEDRETRSMREQMAQLEARLAAVEAAKSDPDRAVSVADVVSQIESLAASKTVSHIQAQIAKAFLTGDSAYLEGVSEPRRRQLLALLKSP